MNRCRLLFALRAWICVAALCVGLLGCAIAANAQDPFGDDGHAPRGETAASPPAASNDPPVKAGRRALDSLYDANWYDDQTDDVRGVNPPLKPTPPPQPQTSPSSPTSQGSWEFLQVLFWILIAAVLLLVAWMILRAFLDKDSARYQAVSRNPGTISQVSRLAELPLEVNAEVGDFLSEARRLTETGDTRRAIIYLYSHLLLKLDFAQAIYLTKGKTNRLYYRELFARRELTSYFHQTMTAFEESFFGDHALSAARMQKLLAAWPEFEQLLTPPAGGAR